MKKRALNMAQTRRNRTRSAQTGAAKLKQFGILPVSGEIEQK
jgi:hypothetical protein